MSDYYDRYNGMEKLLGTNLASLGTDCISRQAAIDALRTCYDTETITMDNGDEYINYGDAVGEIEQLPSAQPEPCEDAVSRKTILKFLDDWMSVLEDNVHNQSASDLKIIKKDFENLPSAEPQIIRCKDCKHWIPYDWMFSEVWRSKNMADYPEDEIGCNWCDMAMKAVDFCSRAERREVTT